VEKFLLFLLFFLLLFLQVLFYFKEFSNLFKLLFLYLLLVIILPTFFSLHSYREDGKIFLNVRRILLNLMVSNNDRNSLLSNLHDKDFLNIPSLKIRQFTCCKSNKSDNRDETILIKPIQP